MRLSKGNVRKVTRKAATIAYLESLPMGHRFAPDSPCACMYHDLLAATFDVSYVYLTLAAMEVGDLEVTTGANGFARRFQQAACAFLDGGKRLNPSRPRRNGCATISRDEAIKVAQRIGA